MPSKMELVAGDDNTMEIILEGYHEVASVDYEQDGSGRTRLLVKQVFAPPIGEFKAGS
jgi:hypothetical protein